MDLLRCHAIPSSYADSKLTATEENQEMNLVDYGLSLNASVTAINSLEKNAVAALTVLNTWILRSLQVQLVKMLFMESSKRNTLDV